MIERDVAGFDFESLKWSRENRPELYSIWRGMKRRCFETKNKDFFRYGGRGITVCPRWMNYRNFHVDMMPRPSKQHTIDRIDNNGDYCPSNCRWATRAEQERNKFGNVNITIEGVTKCAYDWGVELGLSRSTIYKRVYRDGWSLEKAATTPKKK